jgi:hypothetical protein
MRDISVASIAGKRVRKDYNDDSGTEGNIYSKVAAV